MRAESPIRGWYRADLRGGSVIFGKQYRHCPNCGKEIYDTQIGMNRVLPLCCGDECRKEWEIKHARSILGHDAPLKQGAGGLGLDGGAG